MRKKLFVNKEIQKPLLVRLSVFWIASVIILGTIFYGASIIAMGSVDIGSYARQHLNAIYSHALVLFIISAVIVIIIGIILLLKLSNRIAGPLSRLQNALDNGDKEEVLSFSIRKRDYLYSFIQSLKNFIGKNNEKE